MHVPPEYRTDPAVALQLVREHPLALLVTRTSGEWHMSHLPLILDTRAAPVDSTLEGRRLVGHMNRANPQWQDLRTSTQGRLVFHGPDAYVTPELYDTVPAAPTWNFAAVHLHGRAAALPDDDRLGVLTDTVDAYEKRNGSAWDRTTSHDYFRRLEPAVGAFTFDVERVEAIAKLSQDKSPATRARIVGGLESGPRGTARDLAALMRRLGLAGPS